MKQIIFLFYLGLIVNSVDAQFSSETLINTSFERSHSLTVIDFDSDGDSDIITTSESATQTDFFAILTSFALFGQEVVLLENDGSGNFTEHVLFSLPAPNLIALGDFDGDGRMDISYLSNEGGDTNAYAVMNDGAYGYSEPVLLFSNLSSQDFGPVFITYLNAGDLDNDGDDEVIFGTDGNPFDLESQGLPIIGSVDYNTTAFDAPAFLHSGISSFGGVGFGRGVKIMDFNNDGLNDLIYFGQDGLGTLVDIAFGNNDGSFGPSAQEFDFSYDAWYQYDIADMNNDGALDFLGAFSELLTAFVSGEDILIDNFLPYPVDTANPQAMDLDNDGNSDVVIVNDFDDLEILYNIDGFFSVESPVLIPDDISGDIGQLEAADFNGDGLEDLVVTAGGQTYIFFQQSGNLNTYYEDADSDGFGNPLSSIQAASQPAGYVSNSTDCNDNNANIKPSATEICNGVDDDCDGSVDEGVQSTFYRDQDADGFGNSAITILACTAPAGYVSNSSDCNDNNANIKPGATEICNGIDDNCNGTIDEGFSPTTFYRDQDNDGFGNISITIISCSAPAGYVSNSNDCNDNNFNIKPGATETCNGLDDDCDGQIDEGVKSTFYRDLDGDGFGNINLTTLACTAPAGYVSNSTDCNDNNSGIRPGATELCNAIDDDCDGLIDEGCTGSAPANNEPAQAQTLSVSFTGGCSALTGNLTNATASAASLSSAITGQDIWYKFTAPSPGVSIRVQTTAINAIIELQNMDGTVIDIENINSAVGNETLNIGNLVEGNQYRFAVRNFNSAQGTGTFTICVSRFNDSMCGSANTSYPLCALFKALSVNAASYTYHFTHSQTNAVYTGTINSTYILLYNIPGLLPGASYTVTIDATFNVNNGLNQPESITIVGTVACSITIQPHAVQYLRTVDACPNIRQLTNTIKVEPAVCSANNYEWEFTRIAPTPGAPITKLTGSNSQYMPLSTVAGLTNGTYNVRIRPIFPNNAVGNYCPVQCLQIGAIAAGMIQTDGEGTTSEYIIERTEETSIDVYPVPANQFINILSEDQEISSIEIYDMSGKLALYNNAVNRNFIELNLADLPNGIYFIRAKLANADVVSRKIMVAH